MNKGNQFWRLREKDGREYDYKTFEEFKGKCYEYFEYKETDFVYVEESHVKEGTVTLRKQTPYLKEELYPFLGISRGTWNNYKERGSDFLTLITHVEEIIVGNKKRGAYVGIFNANIVKADIGLVDQSQTNLKVEHEIFNSLDINVQEDNSTNENSTTE
jgi:hypothetical protein